MLKIGVIGAGSTGKIHLDHWKLIPDVEIVGFYEPDDDNANIVSEKYQLPRFLHAAMMIDSCDALDITAPVAYRFEWCENAIKKGKHVFVANPMSGSMSEAKQLIHLVEESGIKFQVQATDRFNPALIVSKLVLTNPLFIEVQHFLPINEETDKNNIIPDLLISDIDLALDVMKSDIKNISASSLSVIADDPDFVSVRLEFHNGSTANLTISRVSMKNSRTVQLFQKDIHLEIDLLNKKTELIKTKEPEDPDVFALDIETLAGRKTIVTDNPFVPEINELKTEMEEFKKSILNNTRPIVSEIDGWVTMDITSQVMNKAGNPIFTK
jgi:predicted dehydrogenase